MSLRKNLIDFTVGADPEFMMVKRDTDEIVYATHVCNAMREHSALHELGADGCGHTFEARPEPSVSPIQIVNNLYNIFIGHVARHPNLLDYKWKAGSFQHNASLGGHIHFGISGRVLSPRVGCDILSNYLGAISILVEDKEEGLKRRSTGYGGMHDHRVQKYGFEYRTPSSWLVSPYVSAAFLCLAKTIIWEAVNNPNAEFNSYVLDSDFRNMNYDKVKGKFPAIWADIVKMKQYQQYKPYIDVLYYLVQNRLEWYAKDGTMNKAWGLHDISSCVPKTFGLDTIWARVKNNTLNSVKIENQVLAV